MTTMKKDGKYYRVIDIGRGQTMWVEYKPNKIILFIKSLFKAV